MRLAPSRIGNKITSFDLQNRIANARCSGIFKNIATLLFAKMLVKGTRRRADWHLNQMKAQFGQSDDVTKRFLQVSRIAVQKMPVVLTGHFGNFDSCDKLFSCHDPVSLWKSLDHLTCLRVFTTRPDLSQLCPLIIGHAQLAAMPCIARS